MGPSPILPIIHTVTISTMLNNKGGNNGHGLKNSTCKQTLTDLDQLRLEKSREMNMICYVDFGADKISDSVSKCFIQGPARCEVVLLPVTEQLVKLISTI